MPTYKEFQVWMGKKHPDVKLLSPQEEYVKYRFGDGIEIGTVSWPRAVGKTFILKLIRQFTGE
jgi:hypothetical protein